MPRFVVLHHCTPAGYARPTHWDLLLEAGDVLRAWALTDAPREGVECLAERLPDHRLHYLTYEGPISDDRGWVTRFDAGEYRVAEEAPHRVALHLQGSLVRGVAVLEPCAAAAPLQWRFVLS